MNLLDIIKKFVLKVSRGAVKTTTTQETFDNLTFTTISFAGINKFYLDQIEVWVDGDSSKKLEFYTEANINKYLAYPIALRNCRNSYWAKSAREGNFKRTSCDLPNTILTKLQNFVGTPLIYSSSKEYDKIINDIIEENDLYTIFSQEVRQTLYQGWGAYKINIDNYGQKAPSIVLYDAQNSYIIKENQHVKALVFFDNYITEDDKRYVVADIRYVKYENQKPISVIQKEAFEVSKSASYKKIDIKTLDFLEDNEELIELPNVPFILGESCVYYEQDGLESEGLCGRSIFYSKIDALDDYDQAISIQSTSIRRSGPKVSYPVSTIQMVDGDPQIPDDFDTEYLAVPYSMDGNGGSSEASTPKVIQPNINVDIYVKMQQSALQIIAGGVISLVDLEDGNEKSTKDSAESIRERSRQTFYTVDHIRKKEQKILKSLLNKTIYLYERFWNNKSTVSTEDFKDYDVQVRFDKFLSPSKEQKVKVYLPMFQSGAISTDKFVRLVYEDEMSEEEMEKEIERIESRRLEGVENVEKTESEGINFNKVPTFKKTTSPTKDPNDLNSNSGMNNHNRSLKAVNNI